MRRSLSTRKDAAAAIFGVDQKIRESLQILWLALPPSRANLDELETNFRRLTKRALRDFREDMELFPTDENQDRPLPYRNYSS